MHQYKTIVSVAQDFKARHNTGILRHPYLVRHWEYERMKDCRTASLLHDLACLNVIYYLVSPINDVRLIRLPIFKEDRIVHEGELAYGVKPQAVLWS